MKKLIKILIIMMSLWSLSLNAEESLRQESAPSIFDELAKRTQQLEESLRRYEKSTTSVDTNKLLPVDVNTNAMAPIRDPFNSTLSQFEQSMSPNRGPSSFLPDLEKQKLPILKLKGVINANRQREQDLLALLQINNKDVYMVRVGDEISFDPTRPSSAIKIMSISRLSVTVQVGTLGNVLIVR